MCVVSMVTDQWTSPIPNKRWPGQIGGTFFYQGSQLNGPTREEFEALKKEVEELKKVLQAAKKYDEVTNQKDCEIEEKIQLVKRVAEFFGIDLSDVFKK
jgi:hypothetical protein